MSGSLLDQINVLPTASDSAHTGVVTCLGCLFCFVTSGRILEHPGFSVQGDGLRLCESLGGWGGGLRRRKGRGVRWGEGRAFLLHDGTLGGATAVLDDGDTGLEDGGLVGWRVWDRSLGLGRTCDRGYKVTELQSAWHFSLFQVSESWSMRCSEFSEHFKISYRGCFIYSLMSLIMSIKCVFFFPPYFCLSEYRDGIWCAVTA